MNTQKVLTHPFVAGELALCFLRQRAIVLGALRNLSQAATANGDEVLAFIENGALAGQGIGYVDVHLLALVASTPGILLWTRDKHLRAVAERLGSHADLS